MTRGDDEKSARVAYLLWFCSSMLGGHRFYLGRCGSALIMLTITLASPLLLLIGMGGPSTNLIPGLLALVAVTVWSSVDLFLIPGILREHNGELLRRLPDGSTG